MSLYRTAQQALGRGRRNFSDESIIPSAGSAYWGTTGTSISQDQAVRIVAIQSCISLLADTISTLPASAIEKRGGARVEVAAPGWLTYPVASDPNETWEDHLSQVVWSQELDGNSFTLALPDVYDPAELYVVNPQRVTIRKRGRFEMTLDTGREVVGPDQLVHIARNRRPGSLRGMSPVEEGGATFAMKRAADRFAAKIFNNAVFLSGQLLLPGPAATEVIQQLKDEIAEQYGGPDNAGKPGIFANGAEWKIPHANLQEMQFTELHKQAKLEAAGLYRVPPYLIGVVDEGAMAYASVAGQDISFEKYGISTRVVRIEKGYRRLMAPGVNLKLSTAGLLRGDIKSRAEAEQFWLQNKVMRPSEVRALEDLPPDPDMPGYLETPNNNAPGGTETRSMPVPILAAAATAGQR